MSRTLNLVDCLLTSARNLQRLGRTDAALDCLQRLVRFRALPADAAAETHSLLAKLYLAAEQYRKARRHLTAALTYQPHCADFHFRLALAIEQDPDARPERRLRGHYVRALQLEPKNASYWLDYAFYLLTLGERTRGLRALRRAYAVAPDDPETLGRVADGLRQEGQAGEARAKLIAGLFTHRGDRRFRALWEQHQFQMLYEQQQGERRDPTTSSDEPPVLLRFVPAEPRRKYQALGGKTLRLDPPAPLNAPKQAQRLPYRRPM